MFSLYTYLYYSGFMKTVHDYLRARLLQQAGIFEPTEPAPSLDVIARMQSCPIFEEYRKNRMIMGYFRYGSLQSQIGRAKYDNIGSIEKRLSIYKSDHNREHLVDIANLAMVEFATHPNYPFRPSDDGVHAVKKSEKNRPERLDFNRL